MRQQCGIQVLAGMVYTFDVNKSSSHKTMDELIGWLGMAAIIIAYALVSFGWLSAQTFVYQILNGLGALGIVFISFKKKTYQPGVLNAIWAVIAAIAIVQLMR